MYVCVYACICIYPYAYIHIKYTYTYTSTCLEGNKHKELYGGEPSLSVVTNLGYESQPFVTSQLSPSGNGSNAEDKFSILRDVTITVTLTSNFPGAEK